MGRTDRDWFRPCPHLLEIDAPNIRKPVGSEKDNDMRVLVIEDNGETADYIAAGLRHDGHKVDIADDGLLGLKRAVVDQFDVLIVDRMLPGLDGLSVVTALRQARISTPILFVSSLGGVEHRVDGLQAGGDDYLIKPFALVELIARVNALSRRSTGEQDAVILRAGDLQMDLVARTVTRGGHSIVLQPREFKILEVLLRNLGRVVTRSMLLEKVWDFDFDPKTSLVETHISRLRGKVDRRFDVALIHTMRGKGYRIDDPA